MGDRGLPHVVIIGGGFGGLQAARSLAHAPVRITLVDRANHHLFQPLLYQVAMAGLSPAEIAMPIRSVLRKQKNVRVLLAEVTQVSLAKREVLLAGDGLLPEPLGYDYLIIAAGAKTSYFGHEEWASTALGLKDLDDAVAIRRRVLVAFEAAEREKDPEQRKHLLTFVVIGGGPTGVELAGAISELSHWVLARDFRSIDPSLTRVILLEAGPRILPSFHEKLSASAVEQLRELGAEVRTGTRVTSIDKRGVRLGDELLEASTVIWAAGVRAVSLTETLGVPLDRSGRVIVEKDCSLPGHPEVFAIGDIARFEENGQVLPGVSPVAIQQAQLTAKNIRRSLDGQPREAFKYFDKGTMATIGRSRAIAQVAGLRMSGLIAWLAWLVVHIVYLIGFRNRIVVLFNWAWSYFTYKRGARIITGGVLAPPQATKPAMPAQLPEPACEPMPEPAATASAQTRR